MGYLNADIGRLQNPRNQQVADFLASFRLVDLLSHFKKMTALPPHADVVAGPTGNFLRSLVEEYLEAAGL